MWKKSTAKTFYLGWFNIQTQVEKENIIAWWLGVCDSRAK